MSRKYVKCSNTIKGVRTYYGGTRGWTLKLSEARRYLDFELADLNDGEYLVPLRPRGAAATSLQNRADEAEHRLGVSETSVKILQRANTALREELEKAHHVHHVADRDRVKAEARVRELEGVRDEHMAQLMKLDAIASRVNRENETLRAVYESVLLERDGLERDVATLTEALASSRAGHERAKAELFETQADLSQRKADCMNDVCNRQLADERDAALADVARLTAERDIARRQGKRERIVASEAVEEAIRAEQREADDRICGEVYKRLATNHNGATDFVGALECGIAIRAAKPEAVGETSTFERAHNGNERAYTEGITATEAVGEATNASPALTVDKARELLAEGRRLQDALGPRVDAMRGPADDGLLHDRVHVPGGGLIKATPIKVSAKPATCVHCGLRAEGNYSIHLDDSCEGPEVPLCDSCGGHETPTCDEIWARIAKRTEPAAPAHGPDGEGEP
jgi:hypothetical protein